MRRGCIPASATNSTARAGTNDGERKQHAERLATVRREKANVVAAIRAAIFTPTVKAELEGLEDEEARFGSVPQIAEVVLVPPRAADRFRAAARNLQQTTSWADRPASDITIRDFTRLASDPL